MNSVATKQFWKAFDLLPSEIKDKAKEAYALWKEDPFHETLQFKRVHTRKPIYSVRIGKQYRALGVKENETIVWFWIGSHSDYDKLL